MAGSSRVIARTAGGAEVALPSPQQERQVVTVKWPANQPAGTYEVAWRATSGDSHPVSGTWTFTYGMASAQPLINSSADGPATASGAIPVWIGLGVAAVLILGLFAWWLLRRKTHPAGESD